MSDGFNVILDRAVTEATSVLTEGLAARDETIAKLEKERDAARDGISLACKTTNDVKDELAKQAEEIDKLREEKQTERDYGTEQARKNIALRTVRDELLEWAGQAFREGSVWPPSDWKAWSAAGRALMAKHRGK